jgi:hypothetical protein
VGALQAEYSVEMRESSIEGFTTGDGMFLKLRRCPCAMGPTIERVISRIEMTAAELVVLHARVAFYIYPEVILRIFGRSKNDDPQLAACGYHY